MEKKTNGPGTKRRSTTTALLAEMGMIRRKLAEALAGAEGKPQEEQVTLLLKVAPLHLKLVDMEHQLMTAKGGKGKARGKYAALANLQTPGLSDEDWEILAAALATREQKAGRRGATGEADA